MSGWQTVLLMLAGAIFFFTGGLVLGRLLESIRLYKWLSEDSRRSLGEAVDILRNPTDGGGPTIQQW